MTEYKAHPAAELFPMMPPDQYEAFKEDIRKNGFQQEIVLYKGEILDGRNRYKAAVELGMLDDLWIGEMDEDYEFDPYQWVISRNLHRRHLTDSQRGMIASKLAKMREGRPSKKTVSNDTVSPVTLSQAAEQLQVGRATVARAKAVQEHGSPELIAAVEQGEITVSKAATIAKTVPKERQLDEAKKPKPKPQKPKQSTKETKQEAKKESKPAKGQKAARQTADDDEYDHPLVEAFKVADYRLNTLKKIIDTLEPFEVAIVRDWAIGRLS